MLPRIRIVWIAAILLFGVGLFGVSRLIDRMPSNKIPSNSKFLTYAGTKAEIIPGSYLVMFDSATVSEDAVPVLANSLVAGTGGQVNHVFTATMRGFTANNLDDAWASAVSARSDVSLVRKDFGVRANGLRGGVFGPVPWNLDRVDQRAPLGEDRDYRFKTGRSSGAPSVPIYILDNGIYKDHAEFMSGAVTRVTDVFDATGRNFSRCGLSVADASHGTAVASIAAGNTIGITATRLMNVKVLDRGIFSNSCGYGAVNWVSAGLEETLKHMKRNNLTKAVINLSLGWSDDSETPDMIVTAQIVALQQRGAIVVAAAGNENKDAGQLIPASIDGVVAVGATTEADSRLVIDLDHGSNFGSKVALWAPGLNIKSAIWPAPGNPTPYPYDSFAGTSIAAPHVAGALALLWQRYPGMSGADVVTMLSARATRNMLTGLGPGSKNSLLYVGEDAPLQGKIRRIARPPGGGGDLRAVQVNGNGTQVLVAGGDGSGPAPFAYAAFDIANIPTGPYTAGAANSPTNCASISSSDTMAYFGCMRPTGRWSSPRMRPTRPTENGRYLSDPNSQSAASGMAF